MAMNNQLSPAGQELFSFGRAGVASAGGTGLGDLLQRQVGDDTEEERLRKKLGMLPTQVGDLLGKITGSSPAVKALFSGWGGGGM
jgi:hypothetical protein